MGKKVVLVSPSLLACDFTQVDKEIKRVIDANADWLHLDIMDGVFVPNISFGFSLLEDIKDYKIFKDVHLMIVNPLKYIDRFISCNANLITFHYEACDDTQIKDIIKKCKSSNIQVGMSIKPNTSINVLKPYLNELDVVLIMSVEPGFGGQKYIESSTDKIKDLRKLIDENNYQTKIEVDGGITKDNAKMVIEAGADIIVQGSALFNAKDMKDAINSLRG